MLYTDDKIYTFEEIKLRNSTFLDISKFLYLMKFNRQFISLFWSSSFTQKINLMFDSTNFY